MPEHRRLRLSVLGVFMVAVAGGCTGAGPHAGQPAPRDVSASEALRQSIVVGRSVAGRRIVAIHLGDPDSGRRLLVVGAIHGDETAGLVVARRLAGGPVPALLVRVQGRLGEVFLLGLVLAVLIGHSVLLSLVAVRRPYPLLARRETRNRGRA